MSILSAPGTLWHLYVEYLWNYQPRSWVSSTASTFRVLAFVVIIPCVLLLLLDVVSYVIARTLGVIEDTKASTSETLVAPSTPSTPSIAIHDASAPDPDTLPLTTPPPIYFRNPTEEEGNLRLSGVGTFSPAPSQPPSPTLSRRELSQHRPYPDVRHQGADSGAATPRDESGESGSEESYALLDRDSGSEDAAVTLRKRTRPRGGADSGS
ncbi:hypothetical protein B0H21DRAFT_102710 [Amylocystis lapponica]|nr:hypothetical protein B0H21DRAFT_102710 [Amylocystis lapponica]